jgi:hypothetical protein
MFSAKTNQKEKNKLRKKQSQPNTVLEISKSKYKEKFEMNSYPRNIRKHLRSLFLAVLASLMFVTSVFANSSNWSFTSNLDGMTWNGTVLHSMTAGTLTNSGTIYVAAAQGASEEVAQWKIIVRRKNTIGYTTICSITVQPSYYVGSQYAVPFTNNCGTITAGNYYLRFERKTSSGYSDHRQVVISGTLRTP